MFIISYGRREINTLLLSFDKTQKIISEIVLECNVSHETLKRKSAFFLVFTMILENKSDFVDFLNLFSGYAWNPKKTVDFFIKKCYSICMKNTN